MKTINWGMIGCGQVTEVKSGPGLYKSLNSKLYGLYNRNYDKAVDYANRHPVQNVFENLDEMLSDENIDIVYIATPPSSHKEFALKCIKYGKIPYIEKPIANTYEEALEIEKAALDANLPVYVAFYRRGAEKFIEIKKLLESGVIGNVRHISIIQNQPVQLDELDSNSLPWRVKKEISGGGKFLDMAVHVFDILQFMFGKLKNIDADLKNLGGYYDVDDMVTAKFEFENGVVGSGSWCYVADSNLDRVEIFGDKGHMTFSGLGLDSFILRIGDVEKLYNFEVPENVSMPYQQSIVNELLGMSKSNADFSHALNISKLTDEIYKR